MRPCEPFLSVPLTRKRPCSQSLASTPSDSRSCRRTPQSCMLTFTHNSHQCVMAGWLAGWVGGRAGTGTTYSATICSCGQRCLLLQQRRTRVPGSSKRANYENRYKWTNCTSASKYMMDASMHHHPACSTHHHAHLSSLVSQPASCLTMLTPHLRGAH